MSKHKKKPTLKATRSAEKNPSITEDERLYHPSPTEEELLRTQYVDLSAVELQFLKYAPAYAIKEAREAIVRVRQLQSQGILRAGIYYLVLIDLVGSTKFAAVHGNQEAAERIRTFVTASFNSLNAASLRNVGLFLKEIGDAVLYVFSHFTDILGWLHRFRSELKVWGHISKEPYVIRTCIHVGEVSLDGVNPLSLAVSQTFKMEKGVKGELDTRTEVDRKTIEDRFAIPNLRVQIQEVVDFENRSAFIEKIAAARDVYLSFEGDTRRVDVHLKPTDVQNFAWILALYQSELKP